MPACTSRQLAEMKMEIIRQLTVFKMLSAVLQLQASSLCSPTVPQRARALLGCQRKILTAACIPR